MLTHIDEILNESLRYPYLQLVSVSIDVSQSAGGSTIERLNLDFEPAVGF